MQNQIQSVIVYRNPVEAAMWESGLIFPLAVGCIAALVVALVVASICSRLFGDFGRKARMNGILTAGSAIATMVAVMYNMV